MRLVVPLTIKEFEQLRDHARAERRHPRDQAAQFISERLQRQDANPGNETTDVAGTAAQ